MKENNKEERERTKKRKTNKSGIKRPINFILFVILEKNKEKTLTHLESINENLAFLAPDLLLSVSDHGLDLDEVDGIGVEIRQLVGKDVAVDGAFVLFDGRIGHGSRLRQPTTPEDLVFADGEIRLGRRFPVNVKRHFTVDRLFDGEICKTDVNLILEITKHTKPDALTTLLIKIPF